MVPESTHNFDRGNFMVGIELFSGNNVSIAKSARPVRGEREREMERWTSG